MNEKKCPACGQLSRAEAQFCISCGRPLPSQPVYQAEGTYSAPQPQQTYPASPQMYTAPSRRNAGAARGSNGKGRKKLAALLSLILVIAILITGFWQPGFFVKRYRYEGPAYAGNSQPFSINPYPELMVYAGKNALDQDRDFIVEEAPEGVFMDVYETMKASGIMLTKLYEVDAGLDDSESFPGTYTMEFDLAKLNIPEALYDDMTVYRIGDNGDAMELACKVRGSSLVCQSNKNSLVALGAVLYWGGGTVVAFCAGFFGYKATTEYTEKWAGLKDKSLMHVDICKDLYRVTWELDQNALWKEKKERLNTIYNAVRDQIKAEMVSQDYITGYAMAQGYMGILDDALASNEEYQTILKQLKDPDWLLENCSSPEVNKVVTALTKAHEYLSQTRGFIPRTNKTDVILVYDNWTFGNACGVAINPYSAAPYMLINMTGFKGGNASASDYDDLHLTVTHELFHIFQTNYTGVDWNSNIIFWEATAVVLEEEAQKFYLDNKVMSAAQPLTDSDYFETLSVTVGSLPASGNEQDYQQNGYTLSRLIKYMQSVRSFELKQLLEAFKNTRSFVASLQSATGADAEDFGIMYRSFCRKNTEQFFVRHKAAAAGNGVTSTLLPPVQLSAGAVIAPVPVSDVPLSAYFREFKIDTASIGGEYALLLKSDDYLKEKKNYSTVNITRGVARTDEGLFFPARSDASAYLFEIHNYLASDGINASYTAYLLTPPANPAVTIEESKRMVIEMPPESAVAREGIIDGYLVTVTSSDGKVTNKHVPYSNWSKELTLSLSKLTKLKENATFTVTVKEYIKSRGSYYYGPVSRDTGSGISEEILDEQLIQAQAGKGEITVSMLWSTTDDLDLHIITPSSSEIYYSNPSADGGTLDVDRQANEYELVAAPIENVYFAAPPEGSYRVFIYNYCDRTEGGASDYMVRVTVGGQSQTFTGSLDGTGNTANILEFRYAAATAED